MRVLFVINILHMLVTVSECTTSDEAGVNADNRNHDASETRQAMTTRMDQTIETVSRLSGYTGQLKPNKGWHYTTGDKPLKLYKPQDEDMTIKQAIKYCRQYAPNTNTTGTRLWDGDTTRAADMPRLTEDHKYWIRSKGRTADNNIRQCATLEINEEGIPGGITITKYSDCRENITKEAVPVCVGNPDNPSAGR